MDVWMPIRVLPFIHEGDCGSGSGSGRYSSSGSNAVAWVMGCSGLPVRRRSNVLVRGTIRDAFQRIRNARQLIHDLVAHRRPLHDHGAPPAELLHRPGGRRDDENYDREKLFTTCDSDRPAEKVKNMIREQIFLPAGAESNNYLIGCHFGADCQPHSQSHRVRTKSKSRRRAFLTFGPPCFAVESQGFESPPSQHRDKSPVQGHANRAILAVPLTRQKARNAPPKGWTPRSE